MKKLLLLIIPALLLGACKDKKENEKVDKKVLLEEFAAGFKPINIPGIVGRVDPYNRPDITFTTRREVENKYLKGLLNIDTPMAGGSIYYYGSLPAINKEKLLVVYMDLHSTGVSNWWTLLRFSEKGELMKESNLAYQVISRGFIRNRYSRVETPNHTDIFTYRVTMDSLMTHTVDSNLSVLRIDLQEFDPADSD